MVISYIDTRQLLVDHERHRLLDTSETMHDTSERRFEIECKLEAEVGGLAALKAEIDRSQRVTGGIVGILSSLEQRLARLQRTILPVYTETGNLQRQQHGKISPRPPNLL